MAGAVATLGRHPSRCANRALMHTICTALTISPSGHGITDTRQTSDRSPAVTMRRIIILQKTFVKQQSFVCRTGESTPPFPAITGPSLHHSPTTPDTNASHACQPIHRQQIVTGRNP